MSASRSLRLGMIGAGRMAYWHLRAYRGVPGVRVTAIANRGSERAAALQRRFGIPLRFDGGLDLLARAEVDAVDVCVPTRAHAALVEAALRRGLHVYCEKPLAATDEEYAALAALTAGHGPIVFNGFNYRFLPEFRRAAAIVRSGRLGTVRYLRFARTTQESPGSYMLGTEALDIFHEFQCHFVDLLDAFGFGEPRRVRAVGTNVRDWALRPDTATTQLEYDNGALAEIATSSATPGLAPRVLVVGDRGTLAVEGGAVRVTPFRPVWSLPALVSLLLRESLGVPWRVLRNPFLGSCRHFVDCVRGGHSSPCDVRAAWRVHRVCSAAQRSAASGLAVPHGSPAA